MEVKLLKHMKMPKDNKNYSKLSSGDDFVPAKILCYITNFTPSTFQHCHFVSVNFCIIRITICPGFSGQILFLCSGPGGFPEKEL